MFEVNSLLQRKANFSKEFINLLNPEWQSTFVRKKPMSVLTKRRKHNELCLSPCILESLMHFLHNSWGEKSVVLRI